MVSENDVSVKKMIIWNFSVIKLARYYGNCFHHLLCFLLFEFFERKEWSIYVWQKYLLHVLVMWMLSNIHTFPFHLINKIIFDKNKYLSLKSVVGIWQRKKNREVIRNLYLTQRSHWSKIGFIHKPKNDLHSNITIFVYLWWRI